MSFNPKYGSNGMKMRIGLGQQKREVLKAISEVSQRQYRIEITRPDFSQKEIEKLFWGEKRDLWVDWLCLKIEEKYLEFMAQNAFRAMFGGDVLDLPDLPLPDNLNQLRKIYDMLEEQFVEVFGGRNEGFEEKKAAGGW